VAEHGRGTALASSAVLWSLALLVCIDLIFIAIHVAKPYIDALRPHYFSLEADRGISEYYQYVKQGAVVVAMLWGWRRTASPSFFVWSLFFAFLLYDDSSALHEQVGETLGAAWALPASFGLRPQDVGEILFALAVGIVTLVVLAVANARERGVALVPTVNILLLLLAALAVCGVLVDAIHVVAYFSGSRLAWVWTIIEDGGELVVMSFIVAYAWQLAAHGSRARWHLPRSGDLARLLGGRVTITEALS
jgi:hypothetical protein